MTAWFAQVFVLLEAAFEKSAFDAVGAVATTWVAMAVQSASQASRSDTQPVNSGRNWLSVL